MTGETPRDPGLLLPEGTRLLHIGPHKTGTTSLQAALFGARSAMLAQGVRHAGRTPNPAAAVRAVTGQAAPTSQGKPPSMLHWNDLVGEVRRAREPRVVLSSEFFSWATAEVIERISRDLDGDRLHAVVTLRPLGRILPSQWQQNVQAGMTQAYEAWLGQVFGDRPGRARDAFWQLHRHDQLIERWAAVLGTERVTAVVVDEKDHAMLLRVFEGFLGLRDGTLVAERDLSNRSMTQAEVEAVRAFNVAAKQAGVARAVQAKTMRYGAAIHMKQREPGPDEARIDTPGWALDRAREVDEAMVQAITATGVPVVGNLASLAAAQPGRSSGEAVAGPVLVPPRVAAEMTLGVLIASGMARVDGTTAAAGPIWLEPVELARVPTMQMAAIVIRRTRASFMRKLRGPRRRRADPID